MSDPKYTQIKNDLSRQLSELNAFTPYVGESKVQLPTTTQKEEFAKLMNYSGHDNEIIA